MQRQHALYAADGRRVAIAGSCNFRDLGGYPTMDGRELRWGVVFRSGVLDSITPEGVAVLENLGVGTVVDLRTISEREARPSRGPASWAGITWSRQYVSSRGDHRRTSGERKATVDFYQSMLDAYRAMPMEQVEGYRAIMESLADGRVPIVFHCFGGKDRTGVGAALLLDFLRVDPDTITSDYVMTAACLELDGHILRANDHRSLQGLENDIREPLMRADPAYLAAMFEKVKSDHGSTEGYFRDALGLSAPQCEKIRSELLVTL